MTSPGCLYHRLFDVTLRCPHTVRSEHERSLAAKRPGVAAADGEMEKLQRYGPAVAPVALESYGRMGYASMHRLRDAAQCLASIRGGKRGCGNSLYAMWRLELERTALFQQAESTLRCLGHSSGLHGWRQRRAYIAQMRVSGGGRGGGHG